MDHLNLSFEITFAELAPFIDYWASRYRDSWRDERFYDPHIGKADLRTNWEALESLFIWKNGQVIAKHKLATIRTNYFNDWTEDDQLECRYLDPNKGNGPIWNIFYLHCRFPDQYPIYDQHAHRAMLFIQTQTNWRDDLTTTPNLVYESYKTYRCFVEDIRRVAKRDLRTMDRALYTFGQFLKLARPFYKGPP
jgi:hypothetical protein